MPDLHDHVTHGSLRTRVQSLTPDAERRWGTMTIGQMLWHVNAAMEMALGTTTPAPQKAPPLPPAFLRFAVLNLPWPKGAQTNAAAVAHGTHDFEAQRARCISLMEQLGARPLYGPWPPHPLLKRLTGKQVSRLQAKHIDHHLRQFGR